MNDRFRFRVWNEKEKIFEEINFERTDGFFISQDGKLFEITRLDYDSSYIDERPDLIKEFCTGIKDKNGKLIYEGDIVLLTDEDAFEQPRKTIVRWAEENACFGLFISHKLYYGFGSYESEFFEVIGNIHENPELLEDTTNCSQLNEVVTNCNQSEVEK